MNAAAIVVVAVVVLLLAFSGGLALRSRHRGSLPGGAQPPVTAPADATRAAPRAAAEPLAVEVEVEAEVEVEVEPVEPVGSAEVGEAPPSAEVWSPPPTTLRARLTRAVELLGSPLAAMRERGRVDESVFQDLEEALILSDVGLNTTNRLLDPLRAAVKSGQLPSDADAVVDALKKEVVALFSGEVRALDQEGESPTVWLFVGVNGVGKTTTIGKLASSQALAGNRVVVAAGDTFRAAATEQLELWATRSGAEIVRGAEGADPSSVVFDAIQHAAAAGVDLVLADTAGRLHTRTNLMEELKKVRRVADRPPGHVREVLLVLDATTGQNGLIQAREFTEAVGVTGVVLTKLDGTAKGGIVLAIRSELGLPIKLVGLGEGAEDLVEFDPEEFAAALFD